ncbi:MAG: 4'-phosphopantetheinyl transferase superfamily protein [Rhodobacteraceae bacterium]|jgi:enterobactin synthetase component D|nr:4'-phosphopantetheinyl transferase superfamily protein [Paracoccaceae bacterium]
MSVEAALKDWLPRGVHVAISDPRKHYPLLGSEADAVATAIEKRAKEFSAGRDAARRALGGLGYGSLEIPVGDKREPIWPKGVCGSITHSKSLCIAVVAQQSAFASIGIDAEADVPLKDELRKAILNDSERDLSAAEAIAVFSMKEALFKTLYPLTQVWFGFQSAAQTSKGVLKLCKDVGQFSDGTTFKVPVLHMDNHVISFCAMRGGMA